jgi:ribosomal protein S12 methylthiotransferase accessory factor
VRAHPDDAGLLEASEPRGDLLAAAPQLISDRTGIIRRFQWVPRELTNPALPYVVRAELGNHEFRAGEHKEDAVCSGKGLTVEAAEISALGEAVERYSSSIWVPEEVLFAPRRDLDGAALDPRDLVLYRPEQYEHLPYLPYRDDARIGWVRARSLVSGGDILVPATAAFMNYHSPHEQPIAQVTSNGLATGPTLLEAVLSAAEEVLERDAFVITWLNRLKTRRVDPRTHPHRELVEYTEAYHRRGVELELYLLPTDHPWHVFMALGVQVGEGRDGPAVVVGLGADLDARQAARQALLEVGQVRPALRRRLREPKNRERLVELLEDPRRVAVLEDHDLLYAAPGAMHAFDFLRQQPITPFSWDEPESGTPQSRLSLLLDTLRSQEGGDLIYYNLTPPDMAPFHLYTVRAILPGYQPIHFGWNQRRLAGRRLYDLSYRLGQRPAPTTVAELNPDPHPLP